jgi:hypothetical protein
MFLSALSALVRRRRGRITAAGPARRRSFRPRLETLEDRRVPAVWAVTSPADNINQPGTLRWAVAQANNGDTIDIRTLRTIVLTQGELYLAHDLTINGLQGPQESVEEISGDHLSRVFEVAATAHVNLALLGLVFGNGVANNPSGTIADTDGGAIFNQGTLTLTNCALFNNRVNSNLSAFGQGEGGAIYNNGVPNRFNRPVKGPPPVYENAVGALTLTNCQLSDNFTGSVGGSIFNEGGNVSLSQCLLNHNTAHAFAGALMNEGGTLTVANSELDFNSAGVAGGAIENSPPQGSTTSRLTVSGCYFRSNAAGDAGGAIDNSSDGGGAPFLQVVNCGFLNNSAFGGGAIDNEENGSMVVVGSLFVQNVATDIGGAISNDSTATVLFCQLIDNAALFGGGIFNAGVLTLGFSLLQTNTPDNLDNQGTYNDLGGNTFI